VPSAFPRATTGTTIAEHNPSSRKLRRCSSSRALAESSESGMSSCSSGRALRTAPAEPSGSFRSAGWRRQRSRARSMLGPVPCVATTGSLSLTASSASSIEHQSAKRGTARRARPVRVASCSSDEVRSALASLRNAARSPAATASALACRSASYRRARSRACAVWRTATRRNERSSGVKARSPDRVNDMAPMTCPFTFMGRHATEISSPVAGAPRSG